MSNPHGWTPEQEAHQIKHFGYRPATPQERSKKISELLQKIQKSKQQKQLEESQGNDTYSPNMVATVVGNDVLICTEEFLRSGYLKRNS